MLPHAIRRSLISMQFWSMFHDRDAIDPAVGLTSFAALGALVRADEPLAIVHARCEDDAA